MPRILVIDDENEMRQLLSTALRRSGYEVIDTGLGQVGIELALSELPDLVLCDVGLLDITGYEVLRALRARPQTHNTPVVLITGLADFQGMREGMTLGADDYVPKPFDLAELLALIAARLRKSEDLRREAEDRAKKLRSHISMMLPHELLNPLSGIIGLADILRDDSAILKVSEAAEIGRDIQRSGERLHRLIRNFLIYAQLELVAAEPERIAVLRQAPPSQFLKVLVEVAERMAEQHHRRADLVLAPVAAEVAMSEANLTKLCEELFDNAFKFSASGHPVEVHARLTDGKLWMTLSDEGCGIGDETLRTVRGADQFERLFTEKRSAGLGLAIAVRMAELHNGRVLIQSQLGTGTSILVELPLAVGTPQR
jgi:signal transduction histidine kinase